MSFDEQYFSFLHLLELHEENLDELVNRGRLVVPADLKYPNRQARFLRRRFADLKLRGVFSDGR